MPISIDRWISTQAKGELRIASLGIQYWIILSVLFIFFILLIIAALSPRNKLRVATLQELRTLSPSGFEQAIATLLEDLGYQRVNVVGGAGDLARDISAIDVSGTRVTVQCKRYNKPVGSRDIQLFIGMLQTEYRGSRGIFVTTADFTRPAWQLGKRHGIDLWSGNYLAGLLLKTREKQRAIQVPSSGSMLEYVTKKEDLNELLTEVREYAKRIEETIKTIAPSAIEKSEFKIEFLSNGVHLRVKDGIEQTINTAFKQHLPTMPQKIRRIFEDVQRQLLKKES